MKYDDEFLNDEPEEAGRSMVSSALLFSGLIVLAIVAVVLILNKDNIHIGKKTPEPQKEEYKGYVNLDEYISGDTFVSDDLDIWDEYLDVASKDEDKIEPEPVEDDKPEEEDLSQGGTRTKVLMRNGKENWVNINKYIAPNEYDNASFMQKSGRLYYYVNGEKASFTGIIVDKNDDYIDYAKVKRDNIDFVLIKIGQRGYQTGNITIDESFYTNLKNAKDAGLHVGVLFSSQAITPDEAEEEAQFVIDTLGQEKIDYPVCFYMNYVANDKARVENITPEEKTIIAKKFMDKIIDAGMNPILYGDKEWLLCNLNYTAISYYDILLDQEEELPDFPYRFKMWKYMTTDVAGVSGKSEMIISFIDYSVK